MEQLNLFNCGRDSENTTETHPLNTAPDNRLKCFRSELKSVDFLSLKDLFSGFDSIKVITFSYDIGFINEILKYFKHGDIILGGNFLVQKDTKFQELLAEICTNAYEAGQSIKRYDRLIELLNNGDVEFRTPSFVLDHRKIYLLNAVDGRTRVIKASANMSKRAWTNEHVEHYEYDDTQKCYEEYMQDFKIAWDSSKAITMDVVSSKKADDLVNGNAILKGVKETGRTVVLQQPKPEVLLENIKYAIDHDKIKEEYKAVLENIDSKSKNGLFEIIPRTIEKIEYSRRKFAQKLLQVENTTENYPSMVLDLYNHECSFNDEPINLTPSAEEVKADIDELLGIFENFEQFVGNTARLKQVHFKLLNAIFCSPFNAKLRCAAKLRGVSASSLPLFALISSETSNSGKTFMVKATLKLMTGKDLEGVKACDYSKDCIRNTQIGVKCVPFFVDETDNSYISRIKDIIKNPEKCENNQLENMPMLIFASNNVLKPEEPIRKRMIFFTVDGALPSSIDKTAYESKGKAILKKLGTGLYREYLHRMMDKVRNELDFIIHSQDIPDEYYPDLMVLSSETFISILEDYGYSVPDYIRRLTWEDDYSSDSNADSAILEIAEFVKRNKKACSVDKENISIELGTDRSSQKKLESWKNILPAEMEATLQAPHGYYTIIINRKEFEKRLGYRIGGFSFFGKLKNK